MELSTIIKKTGHQLAEVRERALRNLLSKLEHGLLCVHDLAQEKLLLLNLLEWFNLPEVPVPEEALRLLAMLAEHPSAAQMLQDAGAVEFLNQLSPKVEVPLQSVIDGILERFFRLPDAPPDSPAEHQQSASHTRAAAFPCSVQDEVPVTGYFQSSPGKLKWAEAPLQSAPVSSSVKCLKFYTFPWLTLTTTDRHILASNESSLQSNNHSQIRTTCDLLQNVIMQDFPAEIFLQRPTIVQNLLSLLTLNSEGQTSDLVMHAIACLQQLCINLRSRLRFHRDPSFHSVKQDTSSQSSSVSYPQDVPGAHLSPASPPGECSPRPSVLGRTGQRARGDGQDGDVTSSSSGSSRLRAASEPPLRSPVDLAHLEAEDTADLQLRQLSLAQLGAAVVERATCLLETESMKVFLRILELLSEALPLLAGSVSDAVWEDSGLIGLDLAKKLLTSLGCLGAVLQRHDARSSDASETSLIHHRMAYVGTGVFTIRLLQTLLPVEKAGDNLPESAREALFLLCMDVPFRLAYPGVHESAVAYLEQASPDKHCLYQRAAQSARFMESTCAFVREAHTQGEGNFSELLELAEQAIHGLPYHKHLPVIQKCVQICCNVWKSAQPNPGLQKESLNVFLKLLSHPLVFVRTETYSCTLNIVKDCLGVQNVARPGFPSCLRINFLLNTHVLYEMSAFGLQDQAELVNSAAKEILLFLLKGQLLMTTPAWKRFLEELHPVLPILQGHADAEEPLGSCVLLISEPSSGTVSDAARVRAAMRLLFARRSAVRAAAISHLTPHLIGGSPRAAVTHDVLSALPSLYILHKHVDVKLNESDRSFLKEESVSKLYGVLTSETVDLALRKAAADQLGVALQDTALHSTLKKLGVTDRIISFLEDDVARNVKSMDCLLEPCFRILRKLVFADASLRHSLAQRTPLLITLLKASLTVKQLKGDVREAAVLMCLLLFDGVARLRLRTDESGSPIQSPFSLPMSVIRRYSLPFQAAVHHAVSPHCVVVPPYSDLLALLPAWEMLQFTWNRAWYLSEQRLLEAVEDHNSDAPEFLDALKLSASQAQVLRVSRSPSGLHDCLSRIQHAASHAAVSVALAHARCYLLADALALEPGTCGSRAALSSLDFHSTLQRFLQVLPASSDDERLLADVALFLRVVFTPQGQGSDDKDLLWLLELLGTPETGALLSLLAGAETPGGDNSQLQASERLQKELTALFCTVLHCLGQTSDRACRALGGAVQTQLATRLLRCLRVSDAPHFYGLPSLERTLRAMVCLSALPGWSTHGGSLESRSLCLKYLNGLLEVISSFYVEWGGNSMSFMGKGVTKNTVLCLLHLSHEMMAEESNAEWLPLWSLTHELPEDRSAQGLAWLVPLWVDRDPEVRFASLGISSALTSLKQGCLALAASCQNISGGLWATLLNVLLDQQECSMVRREAAFILQNLLVMPMPARMDEAEDFSWPGPCVHDDVSGLSLVGLPALRALLYHCHFFQHVSQAVRCMHRYSFEVDFPAYPEGGVDGGDNSLMSWRDPPLPSDRSSMPGSLSTSSTLIRREALSFSPPSPKATPEADAGSLLARGTSDVDRSDSAVSQDSRHAEPAVPRAIVTPELVSALCGLLANLASIQPEFTLSALRQHCILLSLASFVDSGTIERCVCDLRMSGRAGGDADAMSQVQSLLQFLSGFAGLLQTCITLSAELLSQMEAEIPALLAGIFTALTADLQHLDSLSRDTALHTWATLFTLLATALRQDAPTVFPSVSAMMAWRWQALAGTVSLCVQLSSSDPVLFSAAMSFLCAVLTEQSRRGARDSPETPLSTPLSGHPGSQLCELLLQCFEKQPLQDPLKKVTSRAFLSLLACSPSAQSYACRAGLVETLVERMRNIHLQLQQESLNPGKAAQKKKEEGCLRELKLVLQLLRNCLYRNEECKASACDSRLAYAVAPLWPWLLLNDRLMEAALELLCVFTAGCGPACSSLCWGGPGHAPVQRSPTGGSLMHSVMKLATLLAPENSGPQRLAFCLLANLAASRDCKGLLQKSNFFQHFLALSLLKPRSKAPNPALSLWLKLLLSLSFSEDGQQMILKMDGALELIAELALHKRDSHRPLTLLILHNVSFCSANKPKVLASVKSVSVLVSCLESNQPHIRAIGASALWALLHNYQKAKVILKNPSIRIKAEEALTSAREDGETNRGEALNSYLLKCLENLTQLLNH
ncbi:rotatin isoform X2 [Brienomyrus brachyistius]|uniref:rotatin isoform X2 n=1 Tax=Brienomyrus brachyistius TaxID=42636 RepID=UPI0020B22743|nr:rotatin isoform X2 [Brienomyrus brachyistius]